MSDTLTKSHEVLREAIEKVGVKTVAHGLGLSQALIYKWCQERPDSGSSGVPNPLDRVLEVIRLTSDVRILNWLCNRVGGFFVSNPDTSRLVERDLLHAAQDMVKHFAEVLDVVTESIDDDGYITPEETKKIRGEWEQLKGRLETFVTACENGEFHPPARKSAGGSGAADR